MNRNELTEYADYLLQTALYKVQNIADAEDLVQETLVAGHIAIHQNMRIENPKSWLVTVLNRKYYDMLRRKYRSNMITFRQADSRCCLLFDYSAQKCGAGGFAD